VKNAGQGISIDFAADRFAKKKNERSYVNLSQRIYLSAKDRKKKTLLPKRYF
jgi:hypothetical protein